MTARTGGTWVLLALLAMPAAACDARSRSFPMATDASGEGNAGSRGVGGGPEGGGPQPPSDPTGAAGAPTLPEPARAEPEPASAEPEPASAEPEPASAEPEPSEPEALPDASVVEPEPLAEPEPVVGGLDGGAHECPPSDACRDFGAEAVSGCAEAGACPTALDCPFVWTPEARDGAACECTDEGCGFVLAEPCSADAACASGACRPTANNDSVCCEAPCDDDEVCSFDGTFCEPAPVCVTDEVRCSATAAYETCVAGQWTTLAECGALGCNTAFGGCLRAAGDPCTTTSECGEGVCRTSSEGTSVCCTASCDSACRRCAPSGTTCQSLADDSACGTIQCPADTTCRDYVATVTTDRCVAGACGAPSEVCGYTARAIGQPCDANNLCNASGDCSVPKKSLGTSCSAGLECLSGNCADGVCCDAPCGNVCESCNGSGQCVLTADDAACPNVTCDPDTQCRNYDASITSNRCAARGTCKTAANCPYTNAPAGTPCGEAEQCDGSGSCPPRIVPCGATSCPVNPGVCCWYRDLDQASCESGDTCPAIGAAVGRRVFCSSSLQCPSGETCCSYSNPGGNAVAAWRAATPPRSPSRIPPCASSATRAARRAPQVSSARRKPATTCRPGTIAARTRSRVPFPSAPVRATLGR